MRNASVEHGRFGMKDWILRLVDGLDELDVFFGFWTLNFWSFHQDFSKIFETKQMKY